MKNYKLILVAIVMGMLVLTACGKSGNSSSSSSLEVSEVTESSETEQLPDETKEQSSQDETQVGYEKYEDIPIDHVTDFSQVEGFVTEDPAFDPEDIAYRIYLQNVMLSNPKGDTRTEFVVCTETMRRSTGKHKITTMAATEGFLDSFRSDSPYMSAKKEWCDGYYRYTGESIVEVCMNQYQENYGDEELQLYQQYDLVSTFTEDDKEIYEAYDEEMEETSETES